MCSIDVINAVAYLAFLDPQEAKEMQFHVEDIFEKRKQIEAQEEEDDLVSVLTEEVSKNDDNLSVYTDDILTPVSSKSFQALK